MPLLNGWRYLISKSMCQTFGTGHQVSSASMAAISSVVFPVFCDKRVTEPPQLYRAGRHRCACLRITARKAKWFMNHHESVFRIMTGFPTIAMTDAIDAATP